MNVCMILAGATFPPNLRVEKEARALVAAGHSIHLICKIGIDVVMDEEWNGIKVHRFDPTRLRTIIRRLNTLARLVSFVDFMWLKAIRAEVARHRIDLLHVHDLPMVRTALWAVRRTSILVIADLHENYPDLIQEYGPGQPRSFKHWLGFDKARWEKYERRAVSRCDAAIAVVDEGRTRLIEVGVPADLITVVENTEDVAHFESLGIDSAIVKRYAGDFLITYVGTFSTHRGLDTAVRAMPLVIARIPTAKLLIVGDGKLRHELEKLADELGVANSVEIAGKQPFRLVPSFIKASDVCVVPHNSTPQTEAALPHKLFQYWAMGKPVVVSSCRSLKRVMSEVGGGLVFDAGDPRSLANQIIALRDPEVRARLGAAGSRAVHDQYDWRGVTSKKLIDLYARLDQSHEEPH